MATTRTTETYAAWLSRKLDEGGYTARAFSKKMNPEAPEIARRSLRRYLKGMVPLERTKLEIAALLESDETGPVEGADDDEEDDLLAALQARVEELADLIQKARDGAIA
jgi:hypothetical protein